MLLARQVLPVHKAPLAQPARWVILAQQAQRARRALPAPLVLPVLPDLLALRVPLALPVLLVLPDLPAPPSPPALRWRMRTRALEPRSSWPRSMSCWPR